MKVSFADNNRLHLGQVINMLIPEADDVRCAVAFMKQSGLRLIEPALDHCLERGGHIEFIVGLDFRTTDAGSLRTFREKSVTNQNCRLYCYSDPSDSSESYHPKLYLIRKAHDVVGIIGSSNLTHGGLQKNIEINAILECSKDEEEAQALYDIYADIKYQPTRFVPDSAYLDIYEQTLEKMGPVQRHTAKHGTQEAVRLLRQKERALPGPFISHDTLNSWQRLVLQYIPEDEFSTEYMYRYAPEFQSAFPRNRTVRAKMRQVLQQLRDMGLLIHLGRNRWIRRPT